MDLEWIASDKGLVPGAGWATLSSLMATSWGPKGRHDDVGNLTVLLVRRL